MTRNYILIVALGLATAACGGGNGQTARNEAGANGQPGMMANAAGPDGVAPGGAVDVLRREGWRVETIQQANASGVGEASRSAG